MSDELLWLTLVPAATFLYAAGGTWHKSLRRYAYSLLLTALCGAHGMPWLWASLAGICCAIAFSLGYGEGKSWPWRFWVGCLWFWALWPLAGAHGMTSISLSRVAVLGLVGSTAWLGLMRWSRQPNSPITWKQVEITVGFTHSSVAAWLTTH